MTKLLWTLGIVGMISASPSSATDHCSLTEITSESAAKGICTPVCANYGGWGGSWCCWDEPKCLASVEKHCQGTAGTCVCGCEKG